MKKRKKPKRFVVCVKNRGYAGALELRKVYQRLPDRKAARLGWVRVIDESEEDYLFPSDFFMPIKLSATHRKALGLAR